MNHPKPQLKYVDAKELDEGARKFNGADVLGADGTKLGEVEGFVMDVQQGRPRHVAVAADWFIHKHFLLPIGHVALSSDGNGLVADITKERVERFPGFDKGEFETLGPGDLARLDSAMADTWGFGDDTADNNAHFTVPTWWQQDVDAEATGTPR